MMNRETPGQAAPVVVALSYILAAGFCRLALAADSSSPDYATQIAPILQQKCLSCHSTVTKMGGLVVDNYDAVMKGGDHGPMVVPGKSDASLLVKMLDGRVQPLMPFGTDPLPPATIALIKAWIDAGARGPGAGTAATPPPPDKAGDSASAVPDERPLNPPVPYAQIDRQAIGYVGPDRAPDHDLAGPEVRIGLMAPLQGPRKAEGEAMVLAARLALEDHAGPLPDGQRLSLAVGDESGQWGRTSSEIVRLVSDENAVALVTSTEGAVAHLAEQIGNKIGVAVVTLAADSTTTQIDLPWIFRLSADDRSEARALAQEIYTRRGLRKVVVIAEHDHDGRGGEAKFNRAVLDLGFPPPDHLDLDADAGVPQLLAALPARRPDAAVLWTDDQLADRLMPKLQEIVNPPVIFLCQKASSAEIDSAQNGAAFTVARSGADPAARARFRGHFLSRAGHLPMPEAAATYDAVTLVLAALHQAGPNRARVRDQLARTHDFAGASGGVSFDGAGNNLAPNEVVAVAAATDRAPSSGH